MLLGVTNLFTDLKLIQMNTLKVICFRWAMLVYLFFASLCFMNAQRTIDSPLKFNKPTVATPKRLNNLIIERYKTQRFCEIEKVHKFKIAVPHDFMKEIIREIYPKWKEKEPLKKFAGGEYKGYKLAGFIFTPVWEYHDSGNSEECRLFHTKGFRVTVTLWKSRGEKVDEIKIVGFNNNKDALFPAEELRKQAGQEFMLVEQKNSDVLIDAPTYLSDELSIIRNTEEFGAVFLSILTYLDLATSLDYYDDGRRVDENGKQKLGIIIERSVSGLDRKLGANDKFEFTSFRSLSFRPDPIPPLDPAVETRAAIAYEVGKHCPPYWTDEWEKDVEKGVKMELEKSLATSSTTYINNYGVRPSFHIGLNTRFDSDQKISFDDLLLELDMEWFYRNSWSMELVAGRYIAFKDTEKFTIYGLDIHPKVYFQPWKSAEGSFGGTKIFTSAGLGAYDHLNKLVLGFSANAGLRVPLWKTIHFEGGGQFQYFDLLKPKDALTAISVKVGIKFYLHSKIQSN